MNDPVNDIITAEREARADAAWLNAHGYQASVWVFSTALDNYGPESSRTAYAGGFAVKYDGQLVRDDGSMAEYPTAGITIYCQDSQLPLDKLLKDGRALMAFGDGSGRGREYGPYEIYYVAAWNPRLTDKQRDQEINPGILPHVHMHKMTPAFYTEGPKRFYDMRLDPAGDLATGTRVRVVATEPEQDASADDYDYLFNGQAGVIKHQHHSTPMVELDPVYDPVADTTRPYGQLRKFSRASLEPVPDASQDESAS